ncbi:methyltransferase domain-containing protein [Zwartia sp.]|uniref:class I SAM-dependent methyltransferase n=1 Tax=Zwartia sp. TaxID=2978004 RepID=UPI00271F9EDA|nr:methyltransferase domain-containing protein [Zwartia sp.]MDO9026197.1 methyltransferase domain-containing protein [Zwartia sp.]
MVNNIDHLVAHYGYRFFELHADLKKEIGDNSYLMGHLSRMIASILELQEIIKEGSNVLELGFSNFFHKHLQVNVNTWDYTIYPSSQSLTIEPTLRVGEASNSPLIVNSTSIEINFEEQVFPVMDLPKYDLIICTEVIEHMDCDPMWLMCEVNKLLKVGGYLFLTTPNSVSARIFWKVAHGFHPSFFLKYSKNRNPYRHNYEYTPQNISDLLTCSGFDVLKRITLDTFEDPLERAYKELIRCDFNTSDRGDNIFAIAKKTGDVVDRYPSFLYS